MEILCTRPTCPKPQNYFADLSTPGTVTTAQQKFCTACGMPLILGDRYLPEKLLGKGGFGAAYLARDRYTPTMRSCVVKLFQPSVTLTPKQLAIAQSLFQREAAVLEDLGHRHPQIPNLYAFFPLLVPGQQPNTQEEYFYLVQEFIDGKDFEQILDENGPLEIREVIEILVSMLKVLQFVHDNHTIHRDIKPSNIMRHRNGRLYLLDFGAVKQITASSQPGSQKSTGIYSIGFAPPEQMAGGEVYPSTDLYALAVTCIILLTGKDADELYDAYNHTWRWQSYATINPAIATVLERMLLPAPNQRYSSAQAVLTALQQASNPAGAAQSPTALQSGPPVPGPSQPPPLAPPGNPPSRRQRTSSSPPSAAAPPPLATASSPSSLSLLELWGGAAFIGVEGGLLAIALASLLGTTLLGGGTWLAMVAGLLLLQFRRVIERIDLIIIAGATLAAVLIFPPLHTIITLFTSSPPYVTVVVLAVIGGVAAVSISTLFRLIYQVLSLLF